jgi:hypothetical protein
MTTIVFLHIPKTAGQTVHNALARAVGQSTVSPIRVHTQADEAAQMPAGYRLYSGHLDWTCLGSLPSDRFVFSILRDPRERIASFYFFLRKEAAALTEVDLARPENLGKLRALTWSADAYFFGGDANWQRFIRDHYENFYCSYFATKKMRGRGELRDMPSEAVLSRALSGAAELDAIYEISTLEALERDLAGLLRRPVQVTGVVQNAGPIDRDVRRWPKLLEIFESDESAERLEAYTTLDSALMTQLGLAPDTRA